MDCLALASFTHTLHVTPQTTDFDDTAAITYDGHIRIALRLQVLRTLTPCLALPMDKKDDNPRPMGQPNTEVKECRTLIPWLWEGVIAEEVITLLSASEGVEPDRTRSERSTSCNCQRSTIA